MARYGADLQDTASTTATMGALRANATTPNRAWLVDLILGSEAASAATQLLWTVTRVSGATAGTGVSVTPVPKDLADRAAQSQVHENFSAEPTTYDTVSLLAIPLDQRATFRWREEIENALVVPATANAGLGIRPPVSTAIVITATIGFLE